MTLIYVTRLFIVSFLLARSESDTMEGHSFGLNFLNWVCHQFPCIEKIDIKEPFMFLFLHFLLSIHMTASNEVHFLDKADSAFIFLEIRRFILDNKICKCVRVQWISRLITYREIWLKWLFFFNRKIWYSWIVY